MLSTSDLQTFHAVSAWLCELGFSKTCGLGQAWYGPGPDKLSRAGLRVKDDGGKMLLNNTQFGE